MRHKYVISLVLLVIFISPMLSGSDYNLPNTNSNSRIPDGMTNFVSSSDPSSGSGPSLPVSLTGIATDRLGASLQIDYSTSDIHSITLADGWSGSNLQTTIDTLSVEVSDVLTNPSFDDYHLEKWFVDSTDYYGEDVEAPDKWNIVKEVVDEYSMHPLHGYYETYSTSSGRSSTRGLYVETQVDTGYDADPNDEMYVSQLVSIPYRELYSAEITFDYRISSSSSMDDKMHLFVRVAGSTTKYHVFESGDTTDTWLTTTPVTILASSMTDLSTKVMQFDIGIATDDSGFSVLDSNSYGYIDNVQLNLIVRPFPEQIDLKVNGTAVKGATSGSIYPYEDDDDASDVWDYSAGGLYLDGNTFAGTAVPSVGTYGSSWATTAISEIGIQFPMNIPQGAVITSAYLEVEPASVSATTNMRILVAGFNSSGLPIETFTAGLPHLEDRLSYVPTSIDWSPNAWLSPTGVRIRHRTPEITSLIQKVVSDSDWNSSNYIGITLDYMWSSSYQASNRIKGAYGSTYSADELPRLFIEYMIPEPEDTVYFMQYEKDITIDPSMTTAILNDFPVMIDITDADLAAKAQADGDDIVFMIDDEAVDFEIEYFNQGTGDLVAWVKVPTLYASRDTVITMAYGNPNAGPSSSTKMWDDFETVHHLADDPSGTVYDSTSNNYDGTSFGGMTSGDLVSGLAGNGINFDDSGTPSTSEMISIGQIYTDDWDSFTVSLWVYMDVNQDSRVFSKSPTTTTTEHIITTRIAALTPTTRLRTDSSGASYNVNTSLSLSSWNHIMWSWDASSDTLLAYMNGLPVLDQYHPGTNLYDSNDVFVIGNNNLNLADERFFDGVLDEIRLTESLRSAAWIAAEYNNQNDPSSYLTVSLTERTLQSSWTDTDSTTVRFSTNSINPVDIFPIVTMDISAGGQSLDDNMQDGTSFYVANDTVVEWSANVLVSPPPDADSLDVYVDYPIAEWKPVTVTNPIGEVQTYGTDWTFHDGSVVLLAAAVDIWGVWNIEFESWNYAYDFNLGPNGDSSYDTYSFNIGETAEFKVSTPWIQNARAGLILTDPSGSVWHTDYATTGAGTWDIPSFSNRLSITVPSAQVDTDVQNFPMLVSFVDTDFQTIVQADGDDFVFVQNGEVLAHEIDRFDQASGRLAAWVRANLSSTVNNSFWLYYGNPVIGSTESPETLWSNDYEAAWLLNEDVTDEGTSGQHIDSTSNGYIGTQDGNRLLPSGIANGNCQDFDGNDWITISSAEDLEPTGDVTISGWFRLNTAFGSSSTTSQIIMEKYLDGDNNFHIALIGTDYTESGVPAGSLAFGFESDNGEYTKWTTRISWSAATWTHFACVLDADTPSNNKIYINGADNTDAGSSGGASSVNLSFDGNWGIGGRYGETSEFPTGESFFTGRIDEIRIATGARSVGWFNVQYDNVANIGPFLTINGHQTRTSPEHTIDKLIDSTADAGLWTASFYYNDTGASVSYATGLYEREFIVKHDSALAIVNPTDAVVDHSTYAVAGDPLYIELELTDDDVGGTISGAEVKMNWSVVGVPTELTLNDIGNGRYGLSVDTTDLSTEGQYRVNINSNHPFYTDATDYLIIDLYHGTELDYTDVDSTPVGFDFTATLIFEDGYDFSPITGATITFLNGTPVNVVAEGGGQYNISLGTGSLGYGDHVYTFRATKAGAYVEEGQVTVTFTLRKHYTSVSVIGDLVTPYGEATLVTVEILDLDTGLALVTTSSVDSWSFTSGYAPVNENNPSDFAVSLTTAGWSVGSESVTLSVTLSGIYYSPTDSVFDVEIRNHYTSIAVIGDLITPFGMSTSLTIVITDIDTGATLSASDVASFLLDPASYSNHPESSPSDLIVNLDTTGWSVGTDTVTLSVVMAGNYDNPTNYDFDIQIRNHHTSVTVIGDLTTPFGQSTDLTLVITDTDTGGTLTVAAVSSFTFTPSSYGVQSDPSPSDLDFTLVTSAWSVATETVTLSVVMSGDYNNPTSYVFDIEIRNHRTSLNVIGDLSTPYGMPTPFTIVIIDLDTGATLSETDVASFLIDPASYSNHPESNPTDLDVSLDTTSWAVATESVTLTVVMTGNFDNPIPYVFNIEIRNHHTTLTVSGNLVTPHGDWTTLTVVVTDSDTGNPLTVAAVSSFSFTPSSYGVQSDMSPSDLIFSLDTTTWSVASESVTLSVVMTGNYEDPSNYIFNIEIRERRTSITVIGNFETPYGNITPLTIVITDVDDGSTLSASDVTSFTFATGYGAPGEASPTDLFYDLDTSAWIVGGESVTLSIVMAGDYQNPDPYGFTITIRPMTTSIINEPNDLRFPTGADFKIVVVVTVSEQGTSHGSVVTGMLLGEFSIRNSSQSIPIKEFYELGSGRYNLTIDASYFPEGIYTIYITANPADSEYATSEFTLVFEYTPARSELSSPDRAATTPYDTDFVVTLTFLDIDRDTGITGATITAYGITIYNQVELGSGVYEVTVDVSGLAEGEHLYDLEADQVGYEAQTISFKVVIRIAFTYAIPSVGALDIPVGDDPVFFVEYWDIDHDLPIDDGAPFLATSSWIHSVTITYVPLEERYRVTFITNDDDALVQNFVVSFNFSKGENYQFGLFNISVTIRTHNTDFRLVSAVEPVSYTDNITISVFYGDIDSGTGIASEYSSYRVWNGTVNVLSYLYNVTGQPGYYTIIVPAPQFGGLGLQSFTVFFNWTGPVSTYTDSYLFAAANIVGEDSRLTLLVTAEPTPYLDTMTYTLFYSAVNGTGISNITGNVFVYVEFVGETVDLAQMTIWEINPVTNRGEYSVEFNNDLFAHTGLIYMKVYIDWAKGVEPFYSNRTDTVSVRILPRDTLVSIDPPIQTAYDVNATFTFTFDDVTGALNDPIANDAKLLITTSLADYTLTYDGPSRTFTISFDTVQFGALGLQTFTLDVIWTGSPFYANQTGRSVSVTVIDRQTVLDYQTPSPTQYLDTVTFSVTWTDVVGAATGIEGATITLYEGLVPISGTYYSVLEIGSGVYSVTLNTTYKASPGTYDIKVNITSTDFYYFSREDTRSLTVRYRSTITSSEPVSTVPYSSSFTVILYYQDIITLNVIGNGTSQVTFEILNGSSWIYTIEWKESMGYYELVVETSNQPSLTVGSTYFLHIDMSFSVSSPFYDSDDAYITFEIRSRVSSLERQTAPVPTPYLDWIPFTVYYSDADDGSPITADAISILKGITPLVNGVDFTWSNSGGGVFQINVLTTALDGLGVTSITVQATWSSGAPFHNDAEVDIDLTTTERTTNVEIITPPSQTYYQEDVVFVVSFLDLGTGTEVAATKDLVTILNGATPLAPAQFTMTEIGATLTYEIRFSSTVLDSALVINRIITVSINWPNAPNYYKDDSTSTSVTTIARNTYVSVDRPGNTAYGENATFTFAFVDSTTLPEVLVAFSGEMSIVTNLTENPSLSYDVGTHLFTMSFNTDQFGDIGLVGFYINITWAGTPFYANKTLQVVYVTVTMRQTQVNYDAPAPTPYGDIVTFDVSYIDISGPTDVGIPDATLTIYYLGGVVPGGNYILTPDGSGNFEIQFDTDFFSQPGYYDLNVSLVYTGGYFRSDASAVRTLNVRFRTTILSANPVGQVGYETTLEITLFFQDILTLGDIDDTFTTFEILNDTGTPWVYTFDWQPATSNYLLTITTVGQTTLTLGDHSLWLNMSYAHTNPFYRWDDVYVEFTIRTRTSALDLQEAAIPAPFQENISFVVYYWDADVTEGITGANFVLNSGALVEDSDFFVIEDGLGVYTIYIDSSTLGGLGAYVIGVAAVWPGGAPYHNNAQRDVSVTTVERTATVEILEPANQPRYLDDMVFTFAFVDSINDAQIGILTTYVSIYAGGTLLTSGVDYVITPDGLAFIVTINSATLSPTLVHDFNVTVFVNWDGASSPFYTDDGASMKVSTTERSILVEPQQIETTPVHDRMNITFILVDEDNGNPVTGVGVIIQFRCVNPARTLNVGSEYTLTEIGVGVYLISIDTDALVFGPGDLGNFIFELEVQWNPSESPYYKNKSPISLTGSVDLIWANMQSGVPTPASVEITANVTVQITLTDLDHSQGIDIPVNQIFVTYYGTSITPSSITITHLGSGVYSIEFSTIDLNDFGNQPMNITVNYYPYSAMFVNPSFTVTEITTDLTPQFTEITLNWTEQAYVQVDYNDNLNLNLTSGASLNWTYGSDSGTFTEIGSTGTYFALIDTSLSDSGTGVVTIRADRDKYQLSVTTVTLIVLSLPSELIIESPDLSFQHYRGTPVDVTVYLTDVFNGGVRIYSGVTNVSMEFEGETYYLIQNVTDTSYWYTTLPYEATFDLEPGLIYSARIIADSDNYDPASSVFKIDLLATATTIHLTYPTEDRMDAVYNDLVKFTLNYTETVSGAVINNATIRWIDSGFGINETFTFNVTSGLWELHFNTSQMSYGTWGVTFDGIPGLSTLAEDRVDLAITIKKIATEVISPIPDVIYWGWVGELIFYYNDTYFGRGIDNASLAEYHWGPFNGEATDLGNGYYSILINTTYLDSGYRYTVSIDFEKLNFQISTGSLSLYIEEVPTEAQITTPSDNQIDSEIDELQLPFGDAIQISFFYNDTDDSDGYVGGLSGATITANIYGGATVRNIIIEVVDLGNGTYYFIFDSTSADLFEREGGNATALPGEPYYISITIELLHRQGYTAQDAILLSIEVIERPTTLEFADPNLADGEISMFYGETIQITLDLSESWTGTSGEGVTSAVFTADTVRTLDNVRMNVTETSELGVYVLEIYVEAPLIPIGISTNVIIVTITCSLENYQDQTLGLTLEVNPTPTQETMRDVISYATPSIFLLLLLAVLWTRHFSIPKRLRQMNGQIKNLSKGKMPKPITESKSRQELVSELFNDTFAKLEIKRVPADMPEVAIPIEIPEIRELLVQLAILTHLDQDELDEFVADISKMKMSEQAAFVKEVIVQEAIRAARAQGKTVEEVLEDVASQASRKLADESEPEEIIVTPEEPTEERVFLVEEEEEETILVESEAEVDEPVEAETVRTEKLSTYEIDELKTELIKKGVPNHEIDMIIEQARHLSRELVEELVKSLGLRD
ncbi:MAG: DUF2341 domain-containing protein [Candidatus Thorarchaeota archaeon]